MAVNARGSTRIGGHDPDERWAMPIVDVAAADSRARADGSWGVRPVDRARSLVIGTAQGWRAGLACAVGLLAAHGALDEGEG